MRHLIQVSMAVGVICVIHAAGVFAADREDPFVIREMNFEADGVWYGDAVCYGPHRDGQSPGGASPSREQIREDLGIIVRHWPMLRVYGSRGSARTMLELIREEGLDLKVMLGAWIGVEEKRDEAGAVVERDPETAAANLAEVETAVQLAGEFPGIVTSICVGNETQVYWSWHKSPVDILIKYLRLARAGSTVPVTTADDYNFWNKPESRLVAAEVDFINMYAHPLWNGIQLEDAVDWTRGVCASIRDAHPDRLIVLGETGWATQVHDEGEQARLIKGRVGEAEQAVFCDALRAWARDARQPIFLFEAFDENWKGGPHPNEVEKHWGLYRADRTPKTVMSDDE